MNFVELLKDIISMVVIANAATDQNCRMTKEYANTLASILQADTQADDHSWGYGHRQKWFHYQFWCEITIREWRKEEGKPTQGIEIFIFHIIVV